MGGFVAPIPGVNGAVHALAPLDDRYVAVAGSFDRAGAVGAPAVALWDRRENALLCLGKEGGRNECRAPQFCCQGLVGDVRVALALAPRRLLLGGAFADASSPSGTISANVAVLDFDAAGGGLDVSSWRRVRVTEAGALGRDAGPNGPVTSALCLDDDRDDGGVDGWVGGGRGGGSSEECGRVLLGGWFDGLEAFAWNASSVGSGGVATYNATPDGLLPYPLLTLSLPPVPATPAAEEGLVAVLEPVSVSTPPSPSPSPPAPFIFNWTRPIVGINALVHAPASAVLGPDADERGVKVLGGKLSAVGNVAALVPQKQQQQQSQQSLSLSSAGGQGFAALPLVSMTHPDTPPEGPPCWESEASSLFLSEQQGLFISGHGPSMSLCCFVGALCPFEGVAVSCPFAGGYFCLPNMTQPECCAEGSYCPDPGTMEECEQGSYCPVGSTAMVPCAWWMWCRKPGLERPDKIMAGVAALVLVASIFLVLTLVNRLFLFARQRYRQARDNDRRRRGLLTARGTHNHELQDADPAPGPPTSQQPPTSPPPPPVLPAPPPSGPTHSTNSSKGADGPGGGRTASGTHAHGGGGGGARPSTAQRPLLRERAKVERIDLQFQNLSVELPGSKKRVLNSVTGGFRAGRVTAVMGPSGCGKTTLISALSNRLGWGTRVLGRTFINGAPESSTALHDVMGFVPQDDIMYEDLTVKENLTYCCQLRADPAMSRAEQRRHVDRVIDSLGLFPSRHSIIGSTEERGISGGQRKRVNVGMVRAMPAWVHACVRACMCIREGWM
jgi:ABC-type lipoprotein export system ATPase subunit